MRAENAVLEVGTFAGFSALAWYVGTRATNVEIVTLDVRGEGLHFTTKMFKEFDVEDRICIIKGLAASTWVYSGRGDLGTPPDSSRVWALTTGTLVGYGH
ncbi:hypothetical protein N7G274_006517 [Stereocaulon virgatum]|uniref:O-methyltransferase n=1 Tax=Stereocaulon virgatum TaxID=373712 RepID=A0ABR4AB10_9LECA